MFLIILPFIEASPLYGQYDFDASGGVYDNEDLLRLQLPSYTCPSDNALGRVWDLRQPDGRFGRSNYASCFGSSTQAPDLPVGTHYARATHEGITSFDDPLLDTDGIFRIQDSNFGRKLAEITDGTSQTAMLSELLAGQNDNVVGLEDRGDLRGTWKSVWMGHASYTHWLTPNASGGDAIWEKWCDHMPELGLPCAGTDDQNIPGGHEYAAARSNHPGGVNVTFGDGHVGFYSNDVDWDLWQAISTHNGQ